MVVPEVEVVLVGAEEVEEGLKITDRREGAVEEEEEEVYLPKGTMVPQQQVREADAALLVEDLPFPSL